MQETPDVTRFVRAYTQTHIHSGVLERRIPLPSKKKKKNQSMKNAHDSSSEKKKEKEKRALLQAHASNTVFCCFMPLADRKNKDITQTKQNRKKKKTYLKVILTKKENRIAETQCLRWAAHDSCGCSSDSDMEADDSSRLIDSDTADPPSSSRAAAAAAAAAAATTADSGIC